MTQASVETGLSRQLLRYWKMKTSNPHFHEKRWGGRRRGRSEEETKALKDCLWRHIVQNPQANLIELAQHAETNGHKVSRGHLSVLFKRWRWSFKIPTVQQHLKFTKENLEYYAIFSEWLRSHTDLRNVKFVDEVHFDPRG